ncbi:MAG TPA: electron transport complex subunit RsxA [Ghiorsea sp.]|nr:electron transport complex subunit RsxA [Ghiorsea sp.]HIP07731.1 electron transport complex subunit RsxA [Mariprofundaceae bacterium]
MTEFGIILLSAVLVNNYVLTKFLGICPFLGVSTKLETAIGMSFAVMFVMTLASTASWIIQQLILIPFDILYLQTVFFILIIAALVQFVELVMHKTSPVLYQGLGIFLPLITTNCAVLGVAILNVQQDYSFFASVLYGFGAALGFGLVLVLFSGLRERLEAAPIPEVFKGSPIALITAGMMALAFMGFAGLVKV